jgi:heterodisulfide reductase subunit C
MRVTVKDDIDLTAAADSEELAPVREMVQACIQCGTCTGSCPNEFAMDFTPRRLWRLVATGQEEEVFASKTFTLCSSCYCCTLRCPRGLPLTEAMGALKQVAARKGLARHRQSILFYKSFLESVRRHGRVREMEFMTLYFNGMKNPVLPLRFAALGIKLMLRGKVPLQFPSKGDGRLAALFEKAAELEDIR